MNPQADSAAAECWQQAYAAALRLLARREHSAKELRRKLQGRRCPAPLVEQVVDALRGEGALSDRRFAEAYARGRFERGFGPLRIEAELRERGVSDVLVEEAVAEFETQWAASAGRQRHKRFGTGAPADFSERARQMRFLQQRGFSGEQIRAALGGEAETAD